MAGLCSPRGVSGGPLAWQQETLGREWKEVGGPAPATSPDITAQIRSFPAAAGRPGAAPAPRLPRAAWAASERPGHRRAEPSRAEPSASAAEPPKAGRAARRSPAQLAQRGAAQRSRREATNPVGRR